MKWIGNIFWLIFGGLVLGILWGLAGLLLCITIIGIPFGIQCFKIASFVFTPFGRQVEGFGGPGSCLLNLLWILFFWLGIGAVLSGNRPGLLHNHCRHSAGSPELQAGPAGYLAFGASI